jgi:hypothetical protein
MDKISENQQAVFTRGTAVRTLAKDLFPSGITATEDPKKSDDAVKRTAELINLGVKVIYEAAFFFYDILVISCIILIVKNG